MRRAGLAGLNVDASCMDANVFMGIAIERCYLVGLHTSLDRLGPCLDGAPIDWDWDGFAAHQARYAAAGLAPEEPH
mgnify:CR=1 FL=1